MIMGGALLCGGRSDLEYEPRRRILRAVNAVHVTRGCVFLLCVRVCSRMYLPS